MESVKNFEEEKNNYKSLSKIIEDAIKKAGQTEDNREAKSILIDAQEKLRELKLFWNDREELNTKLQECFLRINQQIEDEKKLAYQEALQNYAVLKVKVDEALFLASNPKEFNETWEFLIEIQSQFKNIRLLGEHRELLYGRLQDAFAKIKEFRDKERISFGHESQQNYSQLNQYISEALSNMQQSTDFREIKEMLIKTQAEIRNARLNRESRDELNARVQDAFTMLHIKQDEFFTEKKQAAEILFHEYSSRANDILQRAKTSAEFNQIRVDIKLIQAEIRESSLLFEQRDELRNLIQEAFETVNNRQDQERTTFENEAQLNFKQLKTMVDEGFTQASESNEYKETREFLKKIQAEFKGIKLIREQREELYNRLQSAFEVLNTRVDIYFKEKKKNWEVRMQYKLSSLTTDIFRLNESITTETDNLSELEDFYQNISSPAVQETTAVLGLKARITSMRLGIDRKKQQVKELETELEDLKTRLTAPG